MTSQIRRNRLNTGPNLSSSREHGITPRTSGGKRHAGTPNHQDRSK